MATEDIIQTQQPRPLLNDKEAAAILGIKPETLAAWRCTKRVARAAVSATVGSTIWNVWQSCVPLVIGSL